jgi:hypothetical protein
LVVSLLANWRISSNQTVQQSPKDTILAVWLPFELCDSVLSLSLLFYVKTLDSIINACIVPGFQTEYVDFSSQNHAMLSGTQPRGLTQASWASTATGGDSQALSHGIAKLSNQAHDVTRVQAVVTDTKPVSRTMVWVSAQLRAGVRLTSVLQRGLAPSATTNTVMTVICAVQVNGCCVCCRLNLLQTSW